MTNPTINNKNTYQPISKEEVIKNIMELRALLGIENKD